MIPDAANPNNAITPNGAVSDLASPAAAQQAAEFDQLITGIATGLLSIVIEDGIKIANEDL
jgi:hypothetical protein